MASRRDVLIAQVFSAIARGAGDVPMSEEATAWLHDRYSPWLDRQVDGKTPQDVWPTMGRGFLARMAEIGKQAAAKTANGEISAQAVTESARTVESTSPCPMCPNIPI
jgi:hypothetical protein